LLILAFGAQNVFPLPWIFFLSWVLMALIMALVLMKLARPYFRNTGGGFHAKELLAFTWPLILAHYAHETRTWADLFFLEYFRGAAEVGQFQAMATLARLLNLILVGFSFAGLPILTGLVSQQSFEEFKKSYAIVGSWMSYFACPVLAYFLFFGREAIGLFFGPMYQDQATALAFLSCGFFVLVTAGMVGPAFHALKWNKKLLAIDLVGIAANVCLNFVLIPIYGIPGAAAATSMSLTLTTGLCLFFLHHGLSIRPPLANKLVYLGVVLAVGLALRFILGDTGLGLDPKLRALTAPVLLSLAALAAILKIYGINPDEKSILLSLKNRVKPGKQGNGKL
jgi:O-antigen/teichoic acid export membrane protein